MTFFAALSTSLAQLPSPGESSHLLWAIIAYVVLLLSRRERSR